MRKLIIHYRDGSRQVVTPRQEEEKWVIVDGKRKQIGIPNFCGDWYELVQAITKENYLKYEIV